MNKDKNEPPGFRRCKDWADNCCCRCTHFESFRDIYETEYEDDDCGCCTCLWSPDVSIYTDQRFYEASYHNTCDKFEKDEQ